MASAELNVDYYAVLEIPHLASIEVVTKSYRRLAKIRHPDKNLNGDSTAAFQLVSTMPSNPPNSNFVIEGQCLTADVDNSFKMPTTP